MRSRALSPRGLTGRICPESGALGSRASASTVPSSSSSDGPIPKGHATSWLALAGLLRPRRSIDLRGARGNWDVCPDAGDAPPAARAAGDLEDAAVLPSPRRSRFGGPLALSKAHWVRPELVAEITYLGWTDEPLLRHTVFAGLREDKPAREARREVASRP